MARYHGDDPWTTVVTVGGLPADEVISSLQKSIRRGEVDNAAFCAYQMALTSPALEEHLWNRLAVIAVEDIGPADRGCVAEVMALADARARFDHEEPDGLLFVMAAVRRLVEATKDRSNDELTNVVRLEAEQGRLPEIEDFMLDMHTRRGQEMGRGVEHFALEGARVVNESADRDDTWRRRWLALLGLDNGQR